MGVLKIFNGVSWESVGSPLSSSYASSSTSASYALSSSYSTFSISSSYANTSTSASNSLTASYVLNAQTASFVQNAQTASYILLSISSSYASSSTSASYSLTASYAETASYIVTAETASYVLNAQTASYVLQAVSSSYASASTSASYALTSSYSIFSISSSYASSSTSASYSLTASFVLNAQTASFVLNAQTASFITTAQTASYVLQAISSSYASSSTSASYSLTASYVVTANTASYVLNAQTASYIVTAQTASYVVIAQTASFVTTAQTASYVATSSWSNNSISSSYASTSTSASYASTASIAYNGFPYTGSAGILGNLIINSSGNSEIILIPTSSVSASNGYYQTAKIIASGNFDSSTTGSTLIIEGQSAITTSSLVGSVKLKSGDNRYFLIDDCSDATEWTAGVSMAISVRNSNPISGSYINTSFTSGVGGSTSATSKFYNCLNSQTASVKFNYNNSGSTGTINLAAVSVIQNNTTVKLIFLYSGSASTTWNEVSTSFNSISSSFQLKFTYTLNASGIASYNIDNINLCGKQSGDIYILPGNSPAGAGSIGIGKDVSNAASLLNAPIDINGNTIITGSLNVTSGITASLFGTSSWSNNSISSSYARASTSASYASASTSASYSVTASYALTASILSSFDYDYVTVYHGGNPSTSQKSFYFPGVLGSTVWSTNNPTINQLHVQPILIGSTRTVNKIALSVTTLGGNSSGSIAIYNNSASNYLYPTTLIMSTSRYDTKSIGIRSGTFGNGFISGSAVLNPGLYWVALYVSGGTAATFRAPALASVWACLGTDESFGTAPAFGWTVPVGTLESMPTTFPANISASFKIADPIGVGIQFS